MNVKELRQKLEKIPDDAAVRFVSGAEDNLTNDYYDTETAIKERVLRCECFTPIPEDEEEKK